MVTSKGSRLRSKWEELAGCKNSKEEWQDDNLMIKQKKSHWKALWLRRCFVSWGATRLEAFRNVNIAKILAAEKNGKISEWQCKMRHSLAAKSDIGSTRKVAPNLPTILQRWYGSWYKKMWRFDYLREYWMSFWKEQKCMDRRWIGTKSESYLWGSLEDLSSHAKMTRIPKDLDWNFFDKG